MKPMSSVSRVLLLAVVLAAPASAAPRMSSVSLYADAGGVPGEQVTQFEPAERLQHFRIRLSETVDASHHFAIRFIAVDASVGQGVEVTTVELRGQAADTLNAHVELPRDWPEGTYELQVKLDGKEIGRQRYAVQPY